MASTILIVLVALLHVYFLVLEMFLWTMPFGMKAFGMTSAHAQATASLAANQGLYNGFLAAGLVWSLLHPEPLFGKQLAIFFLSCVLLAAIYGGYSVSPKILMVQGVPTALALLAIFFL